MPNRGTQRRTAVVVAVTALVALVTVAGCTGSSGTGKGGSDNASAAKVSISGPANGTKDVPTAATVQLKVSGGTLGSVSLAGSDGKSVAGGFTAGSTTRWQPTAQLDWSSTYKVTATAKDAKGRQTTAHSTFTTMAEPDDSKQVRVSSYVGDGMVYGVGLPIVVEFGSSSDWYDIPENERAAVQSRMTVTSTPAVTGTWYWWSGHEVHFRPKDYWPVGTKFHVDIALGGADFGDGSYGRNDLTMDSSIAPTAIAVSIDDHTKQATVTQDGKVLRTVPVSLGATASKTSSGTFVVMTRNQSEIFDSSTFGRPADAPGGYKETVYWDLRFTWDGQYIHAAPWSVASQGNTDVSNGCVNMATANAQWLFGLAQIGDPITIANTGANWQPGDGWTDWNLSWPDFQKGSALPATN
jgi:lipoprotein-anchoring transpeptidase ErfK/SrfK